MKIRRTLTAAAVATTLACGAAAAPAQAYGYASGHKTCWFGRTIALVATVSGKVNIKVNYVTGTQGDSQDDDLFYLFWPTSQRVGYWSIESIGGVVRTAQAICLD